MNKGIGLGLLGLICLVGMCMATTTTGYNGDRVAVAKREVAPLGFVLVGDAGGETRVTFRVHLVREKTMEELEAELLAVSSPGSPRAGQHLDFEATEALFAARAGAAEAVMAWLAEFPVAVEVRSDTLKITASVSTVERMFRTKMGVWMSVADKKALGEAAPTQLAITSSAHVPAALAPHVALVSGLAEVFHFSHPQRAGQKATTGADTVATSGSKSQYKGRYTQVTPALLRDFYGIDYTPVATMAKQCIGSFGSFYNPECLAQFVETFDNATYGKIAQSKGYNCWGIAPNETCAAGQLEADLDVDYMTSIGAGIETWVWNSDIDEQHQQEWMLNWVYEVTGQDGPSSSTPQVFSLSYGLPEVWQCDADLANITQYCPSFGYDSAKYIAAVDAEFVKFGVRGWTVMVATGDDGAAGDSSNLPYQTGYADGVVNQLSVTASAPSDSGSTESFTCAIPVGGMGRGFICQIVLEVCPTAISEFTSGTFVAEAGCSLEMTSIFGPDCTAAQPTVSSNCSTSQFPTKTWQANGITCTIGAYEYGKPVNPGLGVDASLQSQYPAASPYVTAVGATMLTCPGEPECTGPNTEVTCSSETGAAITSAGFFSQFHPVPTWQAKAAAGYLSANAAALPPAAVFAQGGRGAPDVAFMGHNFEISAFDSGSCSVMPGIDGTSASSPSFAGLISLINDARYAAGKSSIGFLNPYLYAAPIGTFSDITQGSNHCRQVTTAMYYDQTCNLDSQPGSLWIGCSAWGYPAAEGWDAATGLGSPIFPALKTYLLAQP
ncbi:family S53 protease [Thecamonas trahens ATCC 50062]|uniref:Family S53 protease n=1 Tax=Thecamonas trahens ATCC 50062 TaxID=461836 RepID=A0A0L0DM93_THETB|nr:family S53 protease [Thecamonas trahens ATCC 50062]KNC53432.1 family S53 protease [Thecamonas trahens ATCC 50062]|eukprot:XP_013754467.1 family S53 protease [Thecamonas trahens ATCC 50062]